MEVLTAYVRRYVRDDPAPDSANMQPELKSRADVQAVLSVIGRRSAEQRACEIKSLDLSNGDLRGADLAVAQLARAMLVAANLNGTNLRNATLEEAVTVADPHTAPTVAHGPCV